MWGWIFFHQGWCGGRSYTERETGWGNNDLSHPLTIWQRAKRHIPICFSPWLGNSRTSTWEKPPMWEACAFKLGLLNLKSWFFPPYYTDFLETDNQISSNGKNRSVARTWLYGGSTEPVLVSPRPYLPQWTARQDKKQSVHLLSYSPWILGL